MTARELQVIQLQILEFGCFEQRLGRPKRSQEDFLPLSRLPVRIHNGIRRTRTAPSAVLGIDYVIRFRRDIPVTDVEGNRAPAVECLLAIGCPRMVVSPTVPGKGKPVRAVAITKSTRIG